MIASDGTSHGIDDQTLIESLRARFRSSRHSDPGTPIESFLAEVPAELRAELLSALIAEEIELRRSQGEQPSRDEYYARFPSDETTVARCFDEETVDISRGAPALPLEDGEATLPFPPLAQIERYKLVSRLGAGGFGEVWNARDPLLNRHVAVKVLRKDKPFPASILTGLLQEGRKLSQLDHEGIVRVLDAGICDGQVFLVSELMAGGSLEDRMRAGRIPVEHAVRWMIELALALHHAHSRGFVHRDVKPANILFDADDHAHLADFGVAVSEEEQVHEKPAAVGTLAYMSPEQARGESHLVDPRSDVYSLGVVFYRLLTGRLPFVADNWSDYRIQLLSRPPRPLRVADAGIAPELEAICLKCLEPEIGERWTTALELSERLTAWQQSQQQPARSKKWTRRAFAAGGLACLGAWGAFTFLPPRRNEERRPQPPANPAIGAARPPLWSRPELIAWTAHTNDHYGYEEQSKVFHAATIGHAVFKVSEGALPLTLDLVFSLHQEVGWGGVFWGLADSSADAELHCWDLILGHTQAVEPVQVVAREHAIHANKRQVRDERVLWAKTLKRWPGERIHLELTATHTGIHNISINGESILPEPVALPEREWAGREKGGLGFWGESGIMSVHRFSFQ